MNLSQSQTQLEVQQSAFNKVALEPNTLERNLILAEHRAEISRLQKLIAKPTKAKA